MACGGVRCAVSANAGGKTCSWQTRVGEVIESIGHKMAMRMDEDS